MRNDTKSLSIMHTIWIQKIESYGCRFIEVRNLGNNVCFYFNNLDVIYLRKAKQYFTYDTTEKDSNGHIHTVTAALNSAIALKETLEHLEMRNNHEELLE